MSYEKSTFDSSPAGHGIWLVALLQPCNFRARIAICRSSAVQTDTSSWWDTVLDMMSMIAVKVKYHVVAAFLSDFD
jgi:hypothetical protein